MVTQSGMAKEVSWKEFGEKVEAFLDKHGKALQDVDVIVGFTKGGMILATTLCALLRDDFPESVAKKKYFSSLRPLPSGFTVKTYRDPCFVVSSPMDKEDENDAERLICDIENFKEQYCPAQNKLNVLLVDDNLTGATRLFAYKRVLSRRLEYLRVRTLAYTRLECFKHPAIDFIVAGYTPDDKYCVMPWHRTHPSLRLPSLKIPSIYFVWKGSLDLDRLGNELERVIGIFGSIKVKKDEHIRICRGASTIYIAEKGYGATLRFLLSKYYPPKRCLELEDKIRNVSTFGELSLCGLGAEKAERICFCCSSLNCNRDVLETLSRHDPDCSFEVKQLTENTRKSILTIAVEEWLKRFKNSIPIRVQS